MEIWKKINGYGDYQVSSMGRFKSLKYGKERIMKLIKDSNGYLQVQLCKNGKVILYLVHRLVAQAFIDNPDNLPQVNHKNENKADNRVENLEWCDRKYNINYGTGRQRSAEKRLNGTQSKPVYQYSLDGEFVAEYPSTNEVERQLGYDQGYISKCCNGKCKTSYGYKWSFIKK